MADGRAKASGAKRHGLAVIRKAAIGNAVASERDHSHANKLFKDRFTIETGFFNLIRTALPAEES